MRCFIAIDLSDEVKKELSKVQEQLQELKDVKMRLVEPKKLHLTIKFLGEISDFQVNKIKESLKKIKFDAFSVRLNDLGTFPTPQYIRIIWVDAKPKEKLAELQQKIEKALVEQGFKKEKRFETHITLARVKFVGNKEALIKKLSEIKVKPIEFQINSFALKKSTLTREGPVYEDVVILPCI